MLCDIEFLLVFLPTSFNLVASVVVVDTLDTTQSFSELIFHIPCRLREKKKTIFKKNVTTGCVCDVSKKAE